MNLERLLKVELDRVAKFAELLTKAAVTFVGMAYVVGILIINLNLRHYGVFSVSLIRVEYVMAGALWLVLTAFGYLLLMILVTSLRKARAGWKTGRLRAIFRLIGGIFVVLVFADSILSVLRGHRLDVRSPTDWGTIGILIITPVALVAIRDFAKRAWLVARDADEGTTPFWLEVSQLTLILTALSWYSSVVFPQMLPAYGGGKPTIVTLLVKSEAMPMFGSATKDSAFLVNYDLIADTPDWIVIAPRSRPTDKTTPVALRIRRDTVLAINTHGSGIW